LKPSKAPTYATGQPKAFAVDITDRVTTTIPSESDLTFKSCSATLPSIIHHRQNFDDSPLRIPPSRLVTRISDTNIPSIRLFEKLGFVVTKRVEVFREVEMRYRRCRATARESPLRMKSYQELTTMFIMLLKSRKCQC
jgi:hypothetical protein